MPTSYVKHEPSSVVSLSKVTGQRHNVILLLLIWLMPLQTMILVPGAPYISPPAILPAGLGLLLICVGYRPYGWKMLSRATYLQARIGVFVLFTIAHGVMLDLWRQGTGEPSVMSGEFIRQLMSLLSGYIIYLYTRVALGMANPEWLFLTMRKAILPHLLLGLLAIIAMKLGLQAYDDVLAMLRAVAIPSASSNTGFRSVGLATEASYLGIILIAIYVPIALSEWNRIKKHWKLSVWLILMALNILGTVSLTTFLTIIAVICYLSCRRLLSLFLLLPFLFALVLLLVSLVQESNNYAALQMNSALSHISGDSTSSSLSFVDTWYSYAGPISNWDWKLTLGLGLGGTETNISLVFPESVADMLREAAQKDRISVLFARVMVEQGVAGTLLFLWIWRGAWQLAGVVDPSDAKGKNNMLLKWALVGCFAGYCLKLGSFSLPYMWVLFAWLEVRHRRITTISTTQPSIRFPQ